MQNFRDWLRTLGAPEDPVATNVSSEWSAMSLLKAIYGQLAGGGLQTALVASLAGTSASSIAVGTGTKVFTTQAGKSWQIGQWLNIASAADPTQFMNGPVAAYSATTLTVNVDNTGGSGTHADWTISLSGTQGADGAKGDAGATGPSGAVGVNGAPTANQISTWQNSTTVQGVSITGLVKGNGASAPTAATAGSDYLAPPSGTAILKANSGGALANATSGTDYLAPPSGTALLKANSGGALANATAGSDYIAPPSGTALLKANSGGALANATAGTDYVDKATTSTLTAGYNATSTSGGTITGSGQTYTVTVDSTHQNFQHITLNGSSLTGNFTFAPPATTCSFVVEVVNGGSGAVGSTLVVSGFTKSDTSAYNTTNGNKFVFAGYKTQNYSYLQVTALQ